MKNILYVCLGCLLSLVLLLYSIEYISFNINHFLSQYEKHNIIDTVKTDEANLEYITNRILLYLKDDLEHLNTQALWGNEFKEVFSEREIEHMRDVKYLYLLGNKIKKISLIGILSILILIVKVDSSWKKNICKTAMFTAIVNYSLLVVLILCMKHDFNKYFNYFHYIFFKNDLWILDPNKEILVQILPEPFFYNTAFKIATVFFMPLTLLGFLSSYYLFVRKSFQ